MFPERRREKGRGRPGRIESHAFEFSGFDHRIEKCSCEKFSDAEVPCDCRECLRFWGISASPFRAHEHSPGFSFFTSTRVAMCRSTVAETVLGQYSRLGRAGRTETLNRERQITFGPSFAAQFPLGSQLCAILPRGDHLQRSADAPESLRGRAKCSTGRQTPRSRRGRRGQIRGDPFRSGPGFCPRFRRRLSGRRFRARRSVPRDAPGLRPLRFRARVSRNWPCAVSSSR